MEILEVFDSLVENMILPLQARKSWLVSDVAKEQLGEAPAFADPVLIGEYIRKKQELERKLVKQHRPWILERMQACLDRLPADMDCQWFWSPDMTPEMRQAMILWLDAAKSHVSSAQSARYPKLSGGLNEWMYPLLCVRVLLGGKIR